MSPRFFTSRSVHPLTIWPLFVSIMYVCYVRLQKLFRSGPFETQVHEMMLPYNTTTTLIPCDFFMSYISKGWCIGIQKIHDSHNSALHPKHSQFYDATKHSALQPEILPSLSPYEYDLSVSLAGNLLRYTVACRTHTRVHTCTLHHIIHWYPIKSVIRSTL